MQKCARSERNGGESESKNVERRKNLLTGALTTLCIAQVGRVGQFRKSPTLAATREVDYLKSRVAFGLLQSQSVNANFNAIGWQAAQLSSKRPATLTHGFARESLGSCTDRGVLQLFSLRHSDDAA
jgi:hypothetical protein